MEKNIMELIGAVKKDFMEEIRTVVREVMEETLVNQPVNVVVEQPKQEVVKEVVKEIAKEAIKPMTKKEAVVEDTQGDEEEETTLTRREELQAMSYNDLKALVKSLGGKAVGKAEVIIDRILELEAQAEDEEEEEEVLELDDATDSENTQEDTEDEEEVEDDSEESEDSEEDEEYEENEDTSEQEQEFTDFLMELTDKELLAIGAKLGFGKPKNWDKEGFISLLVVNLEQLQDALEALGYYDEDEEESEDEVGEDDSSELKAQLEALTIEELADLCDEYELSKKGKKQALVDRLLKAHEEGEIVLDLDAVSNDDSEDEEESEDEWYTKEELEDLEDADLIEIAEVNELEIPYVKKKNKKTLDRASLIEAILSLSDEDEDEEDEEVEEDNSNESESSTSEIEVSEERYAREEEIEEEIRAKYKAKKLKDAVIKKFLTKYNEGNPTYKAPSASEALEEYIEIKTSMVDDEGETYDLEDCYVRDGKYFCCGRELTDIDTEPYCSVCGTIYEA